MPDLSPNAIKFLTGLRDSPNADTGGALYSSIPGGVQSLLDRGYCSSHAALCGPLGIPTGEVVIRITEAGKRALAVHIAATAAAVPGGTPPAAAPSTMSVPSEPSAQ